MNKVKILTLEVDELRVLPEFQIRHDKTTKEHIKTLKTAYQTGQPVPPVVVAELKGVKYLADGFHRVAALKAMKCTQVEAEIVKVKSEDDIRWLAVERNRTHGKKLNNRDKQCAFDIFIKAKKFLNADDTCKSSRSMAEAFGLWSHVQISKTLKAKYKAVYTRMKKDNRPSQYYRDMTRSFTAGEYEIPTREVILEEHVLKQAKDIYKQIPVLSNKGKERLIKVCEEMIKKLEADGVKDTGDINEYDTGGRRWLEWDEEESSF